LSNNYATKGKAAMEVPPISHLIWHDIVTGKAQYQFEFLGAKLLLGYITSQAGWNYSPETIQQSIIDLHNVFARNADLPSVQSDLKRIFGKNILSGCMNEIAEIREKLSSGKRLLLAGDEEMLKQVPSGAWIGGTIPYFMTEEGGLSTRKKIYVTELPEYAEIASVKIYDETTISNVYSDIPRNGFSVIIMPASSATHLEFALNAPKYKDFATRPLIGWISGVHLKDVGNIKPKVIIGGNNRILEDGAVVCHLNLPYTHVAEIGIVNIFEQGDGDTIVFPETGFTVCDVEVNGVKTNFADYITEKNLDTRLPLVADYFGTMINVSFQSVDKEKREVHLYAPVFSGMIYKHAKPINDYVEQFTSQVPMFLNQQVVFSCNCILNYQYSGLEGKLVGAITGPTTFGEVAYQLLNQTMVYLKITDLMSI
jgi:hypothetical protein